MSQKVLVAGSGISGIAAAKLLLGMGGEVVLYDGNEKLNEADLRQKFDEGAKVSFVLGKLDRTDLLGVELSIISRAFPWKLLSCPFFSRRESPSGARSSWPTTALRESWRQLREQTEKPLPRL